MRSFALLAATAATLTIPMPAAAQEAHRELGPHVHGHGTLNIAIENNRVSMELEVPGMDIVGFEHAAESKEQKATVNKATTQLGKPLSVFKLPSAAGCKVAEANVKIEAEHEHEGEDHDHAHAEKSGGGQSASAKEEEEHEHEGHEGHNEFHVAYALDCTNPGRITTIQFDYFKLFKGANGLTVNIVTAKGQSTYEVTRDKPVLDLGGTM